MSQPAPQAPAPRPPIVSRAAAFLTDLTEEHFVRAQEAWADRLNADFPKSFEEPRWKFELEGIEHGLPKLKDTRPTMWIEQWHERERPDAGGSDQIKVFPSDNGPGGIALDAERTEQQKPRDYTELQELCRSYLPLFGTTFGVDGIKAIELRYTNLIRSDLYPEFSPSGGGGLDLGRILETHKNLALPGYGFLLPYRHEMVCKADSEKPMVAIVDIEVLEPFRDAEGQSDNKVNLSVVFTLRSTPATGPTFTIPEALAELDDCHEKLLEFFRKTFTPLAREIFHPAPAEPAS